MGPNTTAWLTIGGFVGIGSVVGGMMGGVAGAGIGGGIGLGVYLVIGGVAWLILRRGVW